MLRISRVRYSGWDGSQVVDLSYKSMFDDLLDKYVQTGDLNFSMEWLLRQGLNAQDFNLQGLNEMMNRLMQMRQDMLNQFSMSGMADQIRQALDEIVREEKDAVRQEFQNAQDNMQHGDPSQSDQFRQQAQQAFAQESFLDGLPDRLDDALNQLKEYDWQSQSAQQKFEELLQTIQQLRDFAQQNWFQGSQQMTLEQARDMMNQFEQINQLLKALSEGDLQNISPENLEELLGPEAAQSLQRMLEFIQYLEDQGMIQNVDGQWDLTAKAMRKIGEKALSDIYGAIKKDLSGRHDTRYRGPGTPLADKSKSYAYGDPLYVDLKGTLMEGVRRRPSAPIEIAPQDFQVFDMEYQTTSSTALMLDMSLSMFREGRFPAAKKVALALEHLIRSRYPRDHFYVIGFSTLAKELRGKELVRASGSLGGDVFTNIQDGLRLAAKLLGRHHSQNKQVILITDGQPTAYTLDGKLHVEWPLFGISPAANRETLKEVRRVSQQGITINTFMLDRSAELVDFVGQVTKINKGRAFYTTPDTLGQYLLVDYMGKKKKKVH